MTTLTADKVSSRIGERKNEAEPLSASVVSVRDFWITVLIAGVATVAKLLIAFNTFGTNDVIAFYRFGISLSRQGLEKTYLGDVAFNHPPLAAEWILWTYRLSRIPSLIDYGITFPFLLRLPGIVADLIVVLCLLRLAKRLRLPLWSLLVLAVSPVSLMVTGFHGNTDPIMVMFLVLAACSCLTERAALSGIFLALSCQVKIIPLFLVPIFLFFWWERRRTVSFCFPFVLLLVLMWGEPLLRFPDIFARRVLFYSGFWGLWGITYWLRLTAIRDFMPVTYHDFFPLQQMVITGLKLLIVAAVTWLAIRRRAVDGRSLFASIGWAWVIFFVFSPAIAPQYMVWLMPFVLVISPFSFLWLTLSSSAFLFFFYNTIAGGLPWYLAISTGRFNDRWLPWSLWPWAVLIVIGCIGWQRVFRKNAIAEAASVTSVPLSP